MFHIDGRPVLPDLPSLAEAQVRGRNDPCWCGSGRKFKRCHIGRDREKRLGYHNAHQRIEGAFSRRECAHPEASPATCSGGIVRAHTIQRSGGLSRIAVDGHVLSGKVIPGQTLLEARPVGVREASTFTGFCQGHDTATFRPLETVPFEGSAEQCFLLAYRALCMEGYRKESQVELLESVPVDRGRSLSVQLDLYQMIGDLAAGARFGLDDYRRTKAKYDRVLIESNWSTVRAVVVETGAAPTVLVSTAVQPDYDFEGRAVPNRVNFAIIPAYLGLSILPTDCGSAIVFVWVGESRDCAQVVDSFRRVPDELKPDAGIRFAFEYSENTFWNQDWWNGLAESDRHSLMARLSYTANPFNERMPSALLDDGLRTAQWDTVSVLTVGG